MSLDRKINRIQFLSGNSLKVIAVLTMLIDHLPLSAGLADKELPCPGRRFRQSP